MDEAPFIKPGLTQKFEEENKVEEILEEKKFSIPIKNETFLLKCSKTKNNSIIFKLKLVAELCTCYYELDLKSDSFEKISKLFLLCTDLDETFSVLINNISENMKEIKIEFNESYAKLIVLFNLPTGKKDIGNFNLIKKEININSVLNVLNSKMNIIQENQKKFEKKLDEKIKQINFNSNNRNIIDSVLNNRIKEIENLQSNKIKLKKYLKQNKNKINDIEIDQNNYKLKLDKYENELKEEKYKKEAEEKNKENEKKNFKDNVIRFIDTFPSVKEKINLLEKNQDKIKESINDDNFIKVNEQILNCKNLLEEGNKDINLIKENQKKLKNIFENKELEIKEIKINQSKFENEKIDEKDYLKKVLSEIENLKSKLKENEKKLGNFMKSVDKITDKKEEKEKEKNKKEEEEEDEEEEMENNPKDFKFNKTISENLFKKNFYNNRACIFTSKEDDKVYIVYGTENYSFLKSEISFDLNYYDVINDEKIVLIEKLHTQPFDSCRYFYDKDNKMDMIITASLDSHVKVINFNKEKVILDLNFESDVSPIINTACFLNGKILVPFSNNKSGTVKFYTMYSYNIGQFKENAGFILGLSDYYWKERKKNVILVANTEGIFSYIAEDFTLYKKFIPRVDEEEKKRIGFDEAYVIENNNKLILIGPCFYNGYLFFWNFKSGLLIHKMALESGISDICLWDNKYIFACYNSLNKSNSQFVLINTFTKKIEKKFNINDKDPRGCGIKVLRNKNDDYLITISFTGKLNLYTINK